MIQKWRMNYGPDSSWERPHDRGQTAGPRRAIQRSQASLRVLAKRHVISQVPEVTGDKEPKRKFKTYPISHFHIDIAEVQITEGKCWLFVAIDRTKVAFVELRRQRHPVNRTIKEATIKRCH